MRVEENIPLAPYTTYKIGGPARYFVLAKSEDDVREALEWARERRVDYFILGGGTNLLVSDRGYPGLIVHIQNTEYHIQDTKLAAGAGASIEQLMDASIAAGLAGLEWAGGLPGSLGGAIRGNAGAFGGEMKDSVVSVRALTPQGSVKEFTTQECRFGYRTSIFKKEPGHVVLSAQLQLEEGDKNELRITADKWIEWRTTKHPLEYGNCGSVFKRLAVSAVPEWIFEKYPEIKNAVRDEQVATAFFIDQCGLKKRRVGDVEVSEKHPNFLVNVTGKARAEDVIILSNIVKSCVLHQFDIYLEEEVQHLGF
jgi:UDP-N-acetylmuramate dehydrogenase